MVISYIISPYSISITLSISVRYPISMSHIDLQYRYRIISCHSDCWPQGLCCRTTRPLTHSRCDGHGHWLFHLTRYFSIWGSQSCCKLDALFRTSGPCLSDHQHASTRANAAAAELRTALDVAGGVLRTKSARPTSNRRTESAHMSIHAGGKSCSDLGQSAVLNDPPSRRGRSAQTRSRR